VETRHPAGQYITFQISGNYFALPAERIREMMPMQPLEPWGTDTPGVLGAVQSRGRLLPIFDLRNELQLRPRASSRQERLLIIKSHHEYEFGFPVDKVTDFVQVSSNDIRDEAIFGHGRMRAILDIDSIVNQERLFAAAFSRISLSRG
jgi:purine-binding chemotaxis protein CheW